MGIFRKRDSEIDRLEELFQSQWTPGPADAVAQEQASLRDRLARGLDKRLESRGVFENIRQQLRKADLKLRVSEYLALHLVLAVVLGGAGLIITRNNPLGAGLGILGGLFGPRIYVTMRQNQRLRAFNDQLPDILGLWVNALRAGFGIQQAMEAISREAPEPAASEFRRVVQEMALGVSMETALNNMLQRLDSEDLDLVFTAVNIQREVGGNLAEILDTISHTIRERVRIKGEIRTLTASGRFTGMFIGLLPIGLAIFLFLFRPQYMGQLLFGPPVGAYFIYSIPCGWPIIAIGLIMIGMGLAIIRRIVDIEV